VRPGPVLSAMLSPAGPGSMGGRLHRKPVVELLLPFLACRGPSHRGRELRAGPGRAGWAGPTAHDDGPRILRPKMAATRCGPRR
jgi:hypothetical protein